MNTELIKKKILDLAIRGKLVEQRPEDGTAEELYTQIQEEKKKLIAEGKIKKEKPLPKITEDEIPFDIPESWKWVRFADIIDVRDGTHDSPKYYSNGIPLITSKNLNNGALSFDDIKYISEEDANIINQRSKVDNNDILFAMIGSIGNPVLVKKDRDFCIKNVALFKNNPYINMNWLYYFLLKEQYELRKNATGGVQSFISLKMFRTNLIPLPPQEEQKRIVDKVEEIFSRIDVIEKAKADLSKEGNLLEKKILDLAIRGKLVEQRPEEGTAEELYAQIQEEKQKLIAEGKIKKEKPLPEITEEEIPFEIPVSWKWVRLGNCVSKTIKRGKSPKYTDKSGTLVFAQKCNSKYEGTRLDLALYLDESVLSKYDSTEYMVDKDIVINSTGGGTMGRVGIYKNSDNPNKLPVVPDSHVTVIRSNKLIDSIYLFYFIKNKQPYLESLGDGSTNQTELKPDTLKELIVPLPPLEEQKRIVAKIEELLPYCDKLK